MTNEEAIRILKDITWNSNGRYEITDMLDTRNLSIQALQENDKLKAEIEQLKEEVLANKNWSYVVERTLKKEIDKNEMLKSELEQSVKLPCKVGDIVYVVSPLYTFPKKHIHERKICRFTTIENDWFFETDIFSHKFSEFGINVFLSREEAEQHLKGKVEE